MGAAANSARADRTLSTSSPQAKRSICAVRLPMAAVWKIVENDLSRQGQHLNQKK
jgi:hypothetical protein